MSLDNGRCAIDISVYCVCHRYPDTYVRNKAVDQLKQLPPDGLHDLLPQLVQVCTVFCPDGLHDLLPQLVQVCTVLCRVACSVSAGSFCHRVN